MNEQKAVRNRDAAILILLCTLVYSSAYIGRYSYTASLVAIMKETGATKDIAGTVTTFFYFTYGCGQLVNAFFCRRYKPRPVIAGILVVSLCSNIAAALLREPSQIRWVWLINGAAQSALWCTVIELLSRKIPPEKKGRAIIAMSATVTIGTALAYSAAALFIALGVPYVTFWFSAGLLGAVALLWIVGTRRLSRMPFIGARFSSTAFSKPGTYLRRKSTKR